MVERITCPEQNQLQRLLDGELGDDEESRLDLHLETCEACGRRLDGLVAGEESLPAILRSLQSDTAPREPALDRIVKDLKGRAAAFENQESESQSGRDSVALDFLTSSVPGQLGRLGHYEVIDMVGRGGMGVVLKAFDSSLRRIVAIKVLARHLADNVAARRRFVREAQAAAAVSHDHLVTIHAVDAANNPPFIVMQFVEGRSLQQRIDESGPLELKEILRIAMQTAAGLAAAHAQGLVHRDIKPANILLENGIERVKITDFGLARAVDDANVTQSGVVAGTPQYMAPEQAAGESVDHRADLFSLGSVMYTMCAGRPPFRSSTTMGLLKRVCEETPKPIRELNPEIPDWLIHIIDKLLAKKSADRFQSASEVSDLLGRHLAELQHARPFDCSRVTPAPADSSVQQRPTSEQSNAMPGHHQSKATRLWPRRLAIAAIIAIACGVAVTEGSGVTQLVQTVIRITRGESTLVIELDDPQIKVTIDGEEVVIRDAGLHEIRLAPGAHRLVATKDGARKPYPITLSRGDRQVVRVHFENASGHEGNTADSVPAPRLTRVAGHAGAWSVAISPDGKLLVTTGADRANRGVVRLWNLTTFEEKWRIEEEHTIRRAAISANGQYLATAEEDQTVKLRDIPTGNVQEVLRGHEDDVRDVAFSSDGRWLVSACRDKLVREWDVSREAMAHWVLSGSTESVDAVAVSPDGRFIAAGGEDKTVRVWDRRTGQLRWHLPGAAPASGGTHTGPTPNDKITDIAYSPDGRTLAASSMDQLVYLWNTETGTLHGILKRHAKGVASVSYSTDGRRIATASWDGTAIVWDAATQQHLATFDGRANQCFGAVFLDSGRQVATVHRNGELLIWDIPSSQLGEGDERTSLRDLEDQVKELRSLIQELTVLASILRLSKEFTPQQMELLLSWINQSGVASRNTTRHDDTESVRNAIDKLVQQKIQDLAARQDDDTTFLRRLYLDLSGTLPTEQELQTFQADPRPSEEKRAALIDQLLGDPTFSERWSTTWMQLIEQNALDQAGSPRERLRRIWQHFLQTRRIDPGTDKSDEDPDAAESKLLWSNADFEKYRREPLHIRVRANRAGELAENGIEIGNHTLRDLDALHDVVQLIASKVGDSLEVVVSADANLKFEALRRVHESLSRAGVKKTHL